MTEIGFRCTGITPSCVGLAVGFGFALVGASLVLAEIWFQLVIRPRMRRAWKQMDRQRSDEDKNAQKADEDLRDATG
jgi:hypothetical protein